MKEVVSCRPSVDKRGVNFLVVVGVVWFVMMYSWALASILTLLLRVMLAILVMS